MIARALRGLRGRLLLALVATSAVTLAVAAAVMLSPLQQRLRTESADNLKLALEDLNGRFASALTNTEPKPGGKPAVTKAQRQAYQDAETHRLERRESELGKWASDLRERTGGARILASDTTFSPLDGSAPAFLVDTDFAFTPQTEALHAAYRAMLGEDTVVDFRDSNVAVAMPVFSGPDVTGVVVAERPLTEVSTAVRLVRNALFAAAGIGLAVAVALALALSSGLTRRLGRLQRAALRITAEGPEAPTPRDRGNDEVGDLARALARMQEELRRQEAARRSFVATASHELRTPLTMLQGTMELLDEDLRDGADLDDAQEQVASARRELRRLAALASELLDLSRLDAAVQLRSEPVELGELARAVAAEFGLRAAERRVEIEMAPPDGPAWARADPTACARVVRILLDNALRYAPEGEPIDVLTRREGREAVVEVADRGPGVAGDEHEHIFERFHRGRGASRESGFGLGLAIGRELAERMGGTLALAESETGARFRLTLPATAASSPSPSPAPDSAAAA